MLVLSVGTALVFFFIVYFSFGRLSARVKYETAEIASAAVAGLDNKEVEGRALHVSNFELRPRAPRAPRAAGAAPAPAAPATDAPAARAPRARKPRTERPAPAAAAGGAEGSEGAAPRRAPREADPKVVWIGNLPENYPGEASSHF